MKKAFLLLLVVASNLMAQDRVTDYFFEYNKDYRYIMFPDQQLSYERTISLDYSGWDKVLRQTTTMWSKNSTITAVISYGYTVSDGEITSFGQIYNNNLIGKTRYNDHLTLLALPSSKSAWIEFEKGERYDCTSSWVYISYQLNNGENIVDKAIKMLKSVKIVNGKETKIVTEYSYWIKGKGRIATYGLWSTSKQVFVNELADFISISAGIEEVSEKEYIAYFAEKARLEEIARKAKEEKIYNEFVANLKPQRLDIANRAASDSISKLFRKIEEIRYANKIETGQYNSLIQYSELSSTDEQTKLYADFPLESELFVDAPEEEKDTIISYILNLMREGIIQDAYVTEPTTKRKCAVGQWMSTSIDVNIERLSFDVVRSKDTWKMADKKAIMPQEYSSYIIQAANNVLANNKKAKKQKVDLMILKFNNEQKGIWHIQVNPTNNSFFNYTMLD
ncbi:MAG: hypothetical protein MJZ65_01170 [Paludibacteraceae bacterium]|nr:hypothetical protein [Paludibacteraceae bacterium]